MNHPSQGNTQMFRGDLDDAAYERVLEDPRAHTGQGYQTRANQPYTAYGNSAYGNNNSSYGANAYGNSAYGNNNSGYGAPYGSSDYGSY